MFDDEEIEDLVDMRYGDRLTFALLSLLFPFVDLRNQFHVDHIFPATRFTERRLQDAGVPDERIPDFKDLKDRLANLQLLQGALNIEKRGTMPAAWLAETHNNDASRLEYQERHLLGHVPDSIGEFETFYEDRRERLKDTIRDLLGRQPSL